MAKPVPSRGSDQFMVRFPEGMREKIKTIADRQGRSMNSQIIHMLENEIFNDESYYKPEELFKELFPDDGNSDVDDQKDFILQKFIENLDNSRAQAITDFIKILYPNSIISEEIANNKEKD